MSTYKSINPSNQKELAHFKSFTPDEWRERLELAHCAYLSHRTTTFSQRSKKMLKVAELLTARRRDLARLITTEMGKVLQESLSEIDKCAWVCEHYAQHAAHYLESKPLVSDHDTSRLVYDPLGVVLAVMPWNFPFWQVFRFAAPALMAGNVGLLKHASNVPQCALAIQSLFLDAGFSHGCFVNLFIDTEDIPELIADDRVVAAALTGSELAGSKVAEVAGKHLKKTVLELGGSDPFVVFADADIDKAVEIAVKSRFLNAGQSCIAAKRFIVEEKVYEQFKTQFTLRVQQLTIGDPLNDQVDIGPMARIDLAQELQEIVDDSVNMGAKIITGKGGKKGSAFFEPMLIDHVRPGMPAYAQELFGPVATLFSFTSEEELISLANATPFGLGASVWTADITKAERLSREIESGAVFVNSMVASDPRLPFGGVKRSGYGRELSDLGIKEFVNQKTVAINKR